MLQGRLSGGTVSVLAILKSLWHYVAPYHSVCRQELDTALLTFKHVYLVTKKRLFITVGPEISQPCDRLRKGIQHICLPDKRLSPFFQHVQRVCNSHGSSG